MNSRTYMSLEENLKRVIYVQVPENLNYAFISKTGKSLVYRVNGTHLCNNGKIAGKENELSDYLHYKLCDTVKVREDKQYGPEDVIKHEFSKGILVSALRIKIY